MKLVKLQSLGARNAVKQKEPASFLILYVSIRRLRAEIVTIFGSLY